MDFRLLGPVQAIAAGRPLALGERKQRLVLAILLLEVNRVVTVDRMVELIWHDGRPNTARRIVQAHVSRLRGILCQVGPDGARVSVARHGLGYLLAYDAQRVDIHAFRQLLEQARQTGDDEAKAALLRRALGLWRGPVLADVITSRLRQEVFASLEEARLTAVNERIDAELRLGRHLDLVDELTGLLARYRDRQPFAAQLMLALYRCGRVPDASAVFRRTRRRLRQEYGLDPSPELTQLHVDILRGDPALDLDGPTVSAGAVRWETATARIPRDVPDFVGRVVELTRLDSLTAVSPGAVAVITGGPGVGKTALAVRWAHRARDDFAGHLYVNLRGHSGGAPMDPVEALAALLGGLGVPADRIPAGLDEAAGLYRSLLSRERVLVILDDARCAEQVRPLLPGGGDSVALVTSRYRLLGLVVTEGAVAVPLDGLDPGAAESLLCRLLAPASASASASASFAPQSTVDSIGELARWCAGLPLALRIVAVNLRSRRPPLAVADYLQDLAGPDRFEALHVDGDRDRGVVAAFEASYAALPSPARRLVEPLSAASENGLAPAALSTLAGLDGEQTRRALCELVDAHVARPAGPGHYALTDAWLRFGVHRRGQDRAD